MTEKDTPTTHEPDVSAELAKSDDVSLYIEDRREEEQSDADSETKEAVDRIIDKKYPEIRKASRYERLKKARDSLKAENEELRKQLGEQADEPEEKVALANATPENAYEAEIEEGRREAQESQQLAERDRLIADTAAFRTRAESVAQQFPDFQEVVTTVRDLGLDVPDQFARMIMRSPHGPAMAYAIAKDALHPEGQGVMTRLQSMANDPIGLAREFGRMEEAFTSFSRPSAPPPKLTTAAPPPMKPVTGGSGAPRDLSSLAAKDDISDYAKARRRQANG